MPTRHYPLHQSPLFKITTKKKLSAALDVSVPDLFRLQANRHFRVFETDGREKQEPVGMLRKVHDRIQELLARIEPPAYLCSGVRGKSTIGNARRHQSCTHMIKTDITGFFAHSKKSDVRRMFRRDFRCSPDVAHILSEIACFNDIIPTGSPLSQNMAFWSHLHMFDRINDLAISMDATFTLYVDDMIFSSNQRIDLALIARLKNILQKHGFSIKNRKTLKYGENDYKLVTGCIISPDNRLLVKNEHKKKAIELLSDNDHAASLLGLISYCRAIENEFLSTTETRIRRQLARGTNS